MHPKSHFDSLWAPSVAISTLLWGGLEKVTKKASKSNRNMEKPGSQIWGRRHEDDSLWGAGKTSRGEKSIAKTLGKTSCGQHGENRGR